MPVLNALSRLLTLTILLTANPLLADKRQVNMVSDPWPPFIEGELGDFARGGIAFTIHQEIFSRIDGVDISVHLIPWKRALREVEQGAYDGIPILLKTPEREAYLKYSDPFLVGRNLVWSVADAQGRVFQWESIDDLRGKRIGIVPDYSYGEQFDKLFAQGELTPIHAPAVNNLFLMLAKGRIDLALASESVGYLYAENIEDVVILPAEQPTDADIYHIGISRKSWAVELLPQINRIIYELQAEGYIDQLLRGNER